jgi:hypothetical protein
MPSADEDGFLSRWSRRKLQLRQGLPVDDAQQTPAAATWVAPVIAPAQPPLALTNSAPSGSEAPSPPGAAPGRVVPQPWLAEPAPGAPPPPPTLADAQALLPSDDFSRFVARGVDPQVKNAALKTLFSDPHFNIMDGLDTYIDDYGKPDPLPPGMLRQMVQSAALGLFDDEPNDNPPAGAVATGAAAAQATPPAEADTESAAGQAGALPQASDADQPFAPEDARADAAPTAIDPNPARPPALLPPALLPPALLPPALLPNTPPHEDTDLRLQPDDDAGRTGDLARAGAYPGRQR